MSGAKAPAPRFDNISVDDLPTTWGNLELGSAAGQSSSAFDPAGAAAAETTRATAAEAVLASAVYGETSRATSAESALSSAIAAAGSDARVSAYQPKFGFNTAALASQLIFADFVGLAHSYPADLAGSLFHCDGAPAADWVATISINGTTVGTLTVLATTNGGIFSTSGSALVLAVGDRIEIVGPATASTSITKGYGTLVGTKS